ncbi:hypothetical protein D9M69_595220 [compost metagenome]
MGDVVLATAQRALHPGVEQVEHQGRVDRNGRLQAVSRLPGTKSHARDEFAYTPGGLQWHRNAVAGQQISLGRQAAELDLQTLQ